MKDLALAFFERIAEETEVGVSAYLPGVLIWFPTDLNGDWFREIIELLLSNVFLTLQGLLMLLCLLCSLEQQHSPF